MSHFVLLLVTAEMPTETLIEAALMPWHEYESTGENNQYVVDVDITKEAMEAYRGETVHQIRLADGTLLYPHEERLWRPATPEEVAILSGADTAAKLALFAEIGQTRRHGWGRDETWIVFALPEGAEKVELARQDMQTFAEYVEGYYGRKVVQAPDRPDLTDEHKYGYLLLNANGTVNKLINRTNPNKKWDGYAIGGRWNGFLQPHYDPRTDPANFEPCVICGGTGKRMDEVAVEYRKTDPEYTCNGCEGKGTKLKWPTELKQVPENIIQKKAVQWAALMDATGEKARGEHQRAAAIIANRPVPNWKTMREQFADVDDARKAFWSDPVIVDFTKTDEFKFSEDFEEYALPEQEFVAKARARAITPYAAVVNGEWIGEGTRGWFGVDLDVNHDWVTIWKAVLDGIPDDHWLTVIDCHI